MYRPAGVGRPAAGMCLIPTGVRPRVSWPGTKGGVGCLAQAHAYGIRPVGFRGSVSSASMWQCPAQPRIPSPLHQSSGLKRKIHQISGVQMQGGSKGKTLIIAKPGAVPARPGFLRACQVEAKSSGKGCLKAIPRMVTRLHMGQTLRLQGGKAAGSTSSSRLVAVAVNNGQAPCAVAAGELKPGRASTGKVRIFARKGNQVGLGVQGKSSSGDEEAKQALMLRRVDAFSNQLLNAWKRLPEEKKEEAFTGIAARFVDCVPPEYLALMAEQFVNAADRGRNNEDLESGSIGVASPGEEPQADNNTLEASSEDRDGIGSGVDDLTGFIENGQFAEAMQQMIRKNSHKPPKDWCDAWSTVVLSPEDTCSALVALCETSLRGGGSSDIVPKVIVELVKNKLVEISSVEQALRTLAGYLEDLVEVSENAWHLHSHVLLLFFPKAAPSATWGFLQSGWNWIQWWQMTERILAGADHFRAFDILVFVLQMMQEKSSAKINKHQVWKEAGRTAKVRKVLCGWGEMDDAALLETLSAYGVEM